MIKVDKLDFENEEEFKYRVKCSEILNNVSIINGNIEKELKENTYNFNAEINLNKKMFNRLKTFEIPEKYIKVNEFLENSFIAMEQALLILSEIKKDKSLMQKAYRYIDESILWIRLSSVYVFKAFEDFDFEKNEAKKA